MKSPKTRSSWINHTGPKSNSNILMIDGEDTDKREEGQVKEETEIGVGLITNQEKLGPIKSWKR